MARVGGSTGSTNKFQGEIQSKLALKELVTIADVTEEIVARRVLHVKLKTGADPVHVEWLLQVLKQDYDDVKVERPQVSGRQTVSGADL